MSSTDNCFFVEPVVIDHAGNWEKAHKLLKNYPALTSLGEELEAYGKKLENTGRIKEAEKLYLALDKVDLAIDMYKNIQRYDEVPVLAVYDHALVPRRSVHRSRPFAGSPSTSTFSAIFISFFSFPR